MSQREVVLVNTETAQGGGGGGGASAPYEQLFTVASWSLDAGDYILTIAEAIHSAGDKLLVQVEEDIGVAYQEVDVVIQVANNGDVTLRIGNDSRFDGRIIIIGE